MFNNRHICLVSFLHYFQCGGKDSIDCLFVMFYIYFILFLRCFDLTTCTLKTLVFLMFTNTKAILKRNLDA